ncbi:GNAT family N-acetyltransferase [Escherichia coli]
MGIMNNIQIRDYQPGDFQQLCAIFIRAVTMTASQHYSPQQIAPGRRLTNLAGRRNSRNHKCGLQSLMQNWSALLPALNTISICYLLTLNTPGGVASALLKPLIKSESELTVDASITAKPFFERYGFQTVKQQRVECRGEWFINFYMRYKQQH